MKPKLNEYIALVDLDGTLADFDKAMKEDLNTVLLDAKVPKYTMEEIKSLIKRQPGWWENLDPIPLGMYIVQTLQDVGFDIVILTKGPFRSVNAWTEKVNWCRKHVPNASVTITQDKGLVYGKVLVDDYPDYIKRWLTWRPRGTVIMPDQPWNRKFKHPQVHRVKTTGDVAQLLIMLAKVRGIKLGS